MLRKEFEIEICAGNLDSVLAADKGGANRVELCDNLGEGGTTPSLGTMVTAKSNTKLNVFVLVRPRGGDFVYTEVEFGSMLLDIQSAVMVGVDGIVTGCLNSDGSVDVKRNKRLIEAAGTIPVTFHRAFDVVAEPFEAFKIIQDLGFQRLLTSGQKNTALEGKEMIAELVSRSKTLKIMPGGGIDEINIEEIAAFTGARSFHASLRTLKQSGAKNAIPNVEFNTIQDIPGNTYKSTDQNRVSTLIKKLENV